MQSRQAKIDHGNAFDWGKTSAQYAQFRDIYPPVFYEQLLARFPEQQGKQILDIGTGTGVLPRHLYSYGGHWMGIDASAPQIEQAKRLQVTIRNGNGMHGFPCSCPIWGILQHKCFTCLCNGILKWQPFHTKQEHPSARF